MAATKAVKKTTKKQAPAAAKRGDVPSFFRLNVEVGNLDEAVRFYETLFGTEGRRQAGSRFYMTCGPVSLQVVDRASFGGTPHPAAKALYFTVKDLEAVFVRAKKLGALSKDDVHGEPGGEPLVRPWGERSFYVDDPWGNQLCFVEAGTVYPG